MSDIKDLALDLAKILILGPTNWIAEKVEAAQEPKTESKTASQPGQKSEFVKDVSMDDFKKMMVRAGKSGVGMSVNRFAQLVSEEILHLLRK